MCLETSFYYPLCYSIQGVPVTAHSVAVSPSLEILRLGPQALGMPEKFQFWRPRQPEAICQMVDEERQFISQAVPTGGGKSASYIAAHLLSGRRTCILTATKGLENQLSRDFESIGLVDIRGRANYRCRISDGMTCEDGARLKCRDAACPYRLAREAALASNIVCTNYAYWMRINQVVEGPGIGKFDVLVCDEGHSAHEEVISTMAVDLSTREIYGFLGAAFLADGAPLEEWQNWARRLLPKSESRQAALESQTLLSERDLHALRTWAGLSNKLRTLAWSDGEWAYESTTSGFRFEPLWASHYAERILFCGVPRVVILSATLTHKSLNLLGISDEDRWVHTEYPYIFPRDRCSVIWVPTARIDHKMKPAARTYWLSRIDQILRSRQDRKGIIHTVSYQRAREIVEASDYQEAMIAHRSADTAEKVSAYLALPPPRVLVSPALSTGYDFPGADCEFQIIAKLPFPDTRGRIQSKRAEKDPEYVYHLLCQDLVQACGRGMRHEHDRCENLIIDNHIVWVRRQCQRHFPRWFLDLYRRSDTIPDPPPKL